MTPLLFALALACQGAGGPPGGPCPGAAAADDWRPRATDDDRRRLREWRDAWLEALPQARAAGHGSEIDREGALLQPDAALAGAAPPPGDYDCRTIKLGTPDDLLPYIEYPVFRCRIAQQGGALAFTKLTGSQRPIGRLYPDTERRLVFLGTMQLGDERRAYEYGIDQDRDLVGLLERVGERRWRLVFPYPHYESLVDVIELIPRNGSR
ncbi:MAG TPA: DUF4893 domain-containing protein [Allosphingosinicella sp.]|jgi:hypothetical protein|nr:DUF4893 domain-containing protein [Allosphingosinicella sp.]